MSSSLGWPIFGTIPSHAKVSHLSECSIKSSTLSLQTAWTGFDPYLYSGGSSPAGPALVENSNCKVFIFNRGIVTDIISASPFRSQDGWCAVHSTPSRLLVLAVCRERVELLIERTRWWFENSPRHHCPSHWLTFSVCQIFGWGEEAVGMP